MIQVVTRWSLSLVQPGPCAWCSGFKDLHGGSRPSVVRSSGKDHGAGGEGGPDGGELRREICADGCDRSDDHDRDQSGDEAVLNGGDARFIPDETEREGFHGSDPRFVACAEFDEAAAGNDLRAVPTAEPHMYLN